LEQLSPFLDNEVHEFALGLPVRWLFGQRCYIRAILSTFPEIAHVPWARTGRVIDHNFTVRMGKLGWDHFRRKAMRRLRRGAPTGPPKVNLLQGPRFRTLADEYLESAAFPDALFDKGYLRNVIAEHFDEANCHDEVIGVLLTLAAGSRLFLEKPVRRCPDEATPVLQSSEQGSSP
jgi:hypothetical protein